MEISKELLSEVLGHNDICNERITHNKLLYMCKNDGMMDYEYEYNIYELAHKNLKQWAKLKNVFNIIDWSEEPEQIFKKVEEIRNEKQLQH